MVDDAPRILGGRYEVGELIGRGGMAEVHIGHDTRLGRTVAVKILRSDLARDPSFQARFRREAQAAAALNHPAIVAVYDTGEDVAVEASGAVSHVPFIVMEYVEGHTVRDILRDGAAVPIEEAVEITAGVLSALEYSHHAGIVHRDIKPANVMLTPTGAVKVMDFGIARAMADAAGTMTQTQAVIGTAQYLSPEQARGEAVDSRSDLYSTGCLLFELLTGRPPFVGDSPVAVAYQHAREVPQPPSAFASDVPEALDRITMKALAKDREQRYSSAADFRADLEAALRGGHVSAPGLGALGAAAAGAGLGAAAGRYGDGAATQVIGTGTSPTQVAPAAWAPLSEDPDTAVRAPVGGPEEDDTKRRRWVLWTLVAVAIAAIAGIVLLLTRGEPAGPDAVALPDLTGMTEEEARAEVADLDLDFVWLREASTEQPAGSVTRTDPAGPADLDPGTEVEVYISQGPDAVEVPDVSGLSQERARAELVGAGFAPENISTETEESPDVPEGSATRTDPAAGEEVMPDAEITLFLSNGLVELPSLMGLTEEEARETLRELGLSVTVTREESDEEPGTVIQQGRSPGLVPQRSSIDIVIAQERTTTTVPDVRGQNCNQAQETLGNAGLNSRCEEVDESGTPNQAIRTDPPRGSVVQEGTEVVVYIARPPADGGGGGDEGDGDGD